MREAILRLAENVKSVFIGKDEVVDHALIALVARGHVLVEDVPGLGKTLLARALSQSLQADFRRIQFTPDLLPADITGVGVFDPAAREFEFQAGPLFSDVLLADEINRSSPRTQSALLEAMEERQVTCEGTTRALSSTFFVMATQNPVEMAGTYPLPEAQLDRFLVRLRLGYPNAKNEARILEVHSGPGDLAPIEAVASLSDLKQAQDEAALIPCEEPLRDYIVAIANASRVHSDVALGMSPRASLALLRAARARAWIAGRAWVGPDDVKACARVVISHRLGLKLQSSFGGREQEDVVDQILESVPIPIFESRG